MAERLGFQLIYVNDLPDSTRSITDLANGRIYLPPASIPGGHGLRSMALQAMAHRLLGHTLPGQLRRVPLAAARDQLLRGGVPHAAGRVGRVPAGGEEGEAARDRGLPRRVRRDARGRGAAVHEPRDEPARHDVHFLRVNGDGALKATRTTTCRCRPTSRGRSRASGSARSGARAPRSAHEPRPRTTSTPTPRRSLVRDADRRTDASEFSITVGVPFNQAKWFRGRETTLRATSTCPDEACCRAHRRPAERWAGQAWPSARHARALAAAPSGTFPASTTPRSTFLEAHADE